MKEVGMKAMHRAARGLATTDELIEHYAATTDIPEPVLAEVIKAGAEIVYWYDGGLHGFAAAAVEAVLVYRLVTQEVHRPTPDRLREGDWHDEPGPCQIGGEDVPTRAEIAREGL